MNRKLIFFDIDGTIIPEDTGVIPESTKEAIKKAKENKNKPTCIIAKTIKGKGVSFMEDKAEWHGKAPNKEEFEKALRGICYENHK